MSKTTHKKVSPKVPRVKNEASSPATRGLAAIEIPQKEAIIWGAKVLFVVAVTLGTGYLIYKAVTRFKKLNYDANYPPSNITDAQAQTRAKAIASSLALFDYVGNEFEVTSKNLSGLNHNGFVKVYNAFEEQKGHLFEGDLNLIEWINDQFSDYEIKQLSFITGGEFF